MNIEVDAADIKKKKTDDRGRFTLGSEYAGMTVTLAVVEIESDD